MTWTAEQADAKKSSSKKQATPFLAPSPCVRPHNLESFKASGQSQDRPGHCFFYAIS